MKLQHTVEHTLDACAYGVVVCTVFELLPPIAAFLSIVWLSIQIGHWIYKRFQK